MADELNILLFNGNAPLPVNEGGATENPDAESQDPVDQSIDPKENSVALFSRHWQNNQANFRRNALNSVFPEFNPEPSDSTGGDSNLLDQNFGNSRSLNYRNSDPNFFGANNSTNFSDPNSGFSNSVYPNYYSSNNRNLNQFGSNEIPETFPNNYPNNIFPNNFPNLPSGAEQVARIINQTWDSIINAAQTHPDFQDFQNQPTEFWNNVRQISEVRVVQTYVNGILQPRAESDYGNLLAQLNKQGGNLQNFVSSLPADTGKVFQARYQINQTFGANELFVGKGIALDNKGQFPVRVFLTANGENFNLPPHTILSLAGDLSNDSSLFTNFSLLANSQFLLAGKSAALLSLSLALYQNATARLSLTEIADNFLSQTSGENALRAAANQNSFDKASVNQQLLQPQKNSLLTAALIGGALSTIENYKKFGSRRVSAWSGGDSALTGQNFSVGATGAIMGAALGCLVPLAEKNIGEITGFAAGVVSGLSCAGIRNFCAQTMTAIISSGAQNILNAANPQKVLNGGSPNKFINVLKPSSFTSENDLRQKIFAQRMKTLTSF